jgi:hypothetical protein
MVDPGTWDLLAIAVENPADPDLRAYGPRDAGIVLVGLDNHGLFPS